MNATILLNQLGGGLFLAMTGAKNFLVGKDHLQMDLPSSLTKGRGNRLIVRLNGNDLYDLTFYRITKKGLSVKVLAEASDVYAEEVRRAFTSLTGLYTRF